jgi:hypothetical protein
MVFLVFKKCYCRGTDGVVGMCPAALLVWTVAVDESATGTLVCTAYGEFWFGVRTMRCSVATFVGRVSIIVSPFHPCRFFFRRFVCVLPHPRV